jgi:hypothetical protein
MPAIWPTQLGNLVGLGVDDALGDDSAGVVAGPGQQGDPPATAAAGAAQSLAVKGEPAPPGPSRRSGVRGTALLTLARRRTHPGGAQTHRA